jgi:hypothetical protein
MNTRQYSTEDRKQLKRAMRKQGFQELAKRTHTNRVELQNIITDRNKTIADQKSKIDKITEWAQNNMQELPSSILQTLGL